MHDSDRALPEMDESRLSISELHSRAEINSFLRKWHYLAKQGSGIRSCVCYGLRLDGQLAGVVVFHTVSAWETVWGCFGDQISHREQEGFWELGRLAMSDDLKFPNLTSWFVRKCISLLRCKLRERSAEWRREYLASHPNGEKDPEFVANRHRGELRALISYADGAYHHGYIYQATGFRYYGTATPKNDFWYCAECEEATESETKAWETALAGMPEPRRAEILESLKYRVVREFRNPDGSPRYVKLSRGRTTPMFKLGKGEWRPRTPKHRYMLVFDRSLRPLWPEIPFPKGDNTIYEG